MYFAKVQYIFCFSNILYKKNDKIQFFASTINISALISLSVDGVSHVIFRASNSISPTPQTKSSVKCSYRHLTEKT